MENSSLVEEDLKAVWTISHEEEPSGEATKVSSTPWEEKNNEKQVEQSKTKEVETAKEELPKWLRHRREELSFYRQLNPDNSLRVARKTAEETNDVLWVLQLVNRREDGTEESSDLPRRILGPLCDVLKEYQALDMDKKIK